MNQRGLLLRVSLYAPMYCGRPEWPPCPARLFQALVAGASHRLADPDVRAAFRWLEQQSAPCVAVPRCIPDLALPLDAPSRDLGANGPANGRSIRTAQRARARQLTHSELLFAWLFDADEEAAARAVLPLAAGLNQLGRGVDTASARGEIIDQRELRDLFAAWSADGSGEVYYPTLGRAGESLRCPRVGTTDSLSRQHRAHGERVPVHGDGPDASEVYALPPEGLHRSIAYDCNARRAVFELRQSEDLSRFAPFPATRVVDQVTQWRDAAALQLAEAGLQAHGVQGVLLGRRSTEPERVPLSARARLIPLPSRDHDHADEQVRRILVELPTGGPLPFDELREAFSGLRVDGTTLVQTQDRTAGEPFLDKSTTWITVTPVAVPALRGSSASCAGPDPAWGPTDGEDEQAAAIRAVRHALRHAEIDTPCRAIEVQRDAFTPNGTRADEFQRRPRFRAGGLWHVRVDFARPVAGPVVLGDGRYLGLGVMQPAEQAPMPVVAWTIREGLQGPMRPIDLARHLRRAVLARARRAWGRKTLPSFVSGHQPDGSPAKEHRHLHYLIDPIELRLLVWQPQPSERLVRILRELTELRAGDMGVLQVDITPLDDADRLIAAGTRWRTVTPYRVQRHRKAKTAASVVELDVRASCPQWPLRSVEVTSVQSVSGGIEAHLELQFDRPVTGPLALGKTRHIGGGLFECVRPRRAC